MKFQQWFLCGLFVLSTPIFAVEISEEKEKRLDNLLDLGLQELGEVEVKLEDVFDVFDGLVTQNTVTLASGVEQSTDSAPASITVMTAQDIEAMGARSLDEILEIVPGLHISLTQVGFNGQYDIRGMHSDNNNEVLVMLNGIPIKSILDGSRSGWLPPPVQLIQRVEVIRGPGSALYGADAVSGVVNIITKQHAEQINKQRENETSSTEVGVRAGSFQSYGAWALHGQRVNDWDMVVSLDYSQTDGHKEEVIGDSQTLLDQRTGTNLSLAPGRAYLQRKHIDIATSINKKYWQFNFSGQRTYDAGSALGNAFVINPEETYDISFYQVALNYKNPHFTQNWELESSLSFKNAENQYENTYTYRPGSISETGEYLPNGLFGNYAFNQRQTRFELSGIYHGLQNHLIRLGSGYVYDDLYEVTWLGMLDNNSLQLIDVEATSDKRLLPENIRQNTYIFLQDTWTFDPAWQFVWGARYDHYSDFESSINPRAALVWQAHPQLTAKIFFGKSFRAPSFIEMYTPANRIVTGNPNLAAEKNMTWEIGFDYRINQSLYTTVNLFTYTIKDKIQRRVFSDFSESVYTYANVGTNHGQGFEIETRWKINGKSSLLANYAYVDVKNDDDEQVGNYPHHQIYLRHDWLLGNRWFLDTRLNWTANWELPYNNSFSSLAIDDSINIDMTLRYKALQKQGWNFAVGVRNLFDQEQREPNYYPKAGREGFAEVRYQF